MLSKKNEVPLPMVPGGGGFRTSTLARVSWTFQPCSAFNLETHQDRIFDRPGVETAPFLRLLESEHFIETSRFQVPFSNLQERSLDPHPRGALEHQRKKEPAKAAPSAVSVHDEIDDVHFGGVHPHHDERAHALRR